MIYVILYVQSNIHILSINPKSTDKNIEIVRLDVVIGVRTSALSLTWVDFISYLSFYLFIKDK